MDGKLAYLGEPNIDFKGLRIWVHGRQFPETTGEYWNDNWLRVTIHYHSDNSDFFLKNESAVHLGDLNHLRFECMALKEGKKESADIEFTEPYLHFKFDFKPKGAELRLMLQIPAVERHDYTIAVSKNDLELILTQVENIFVRYPLVGDP